jgi:hypothetical protein
VLEIWKNRESPDLAGKINKYPMDPNFQVSDFNYVPPKVQLETAKAASKEAWRYINNNPEQVIKYTWIKFKRFISGTYVIQNKRGTEKLLKWRILLYPLSNLPISVLAIIGLFVLIRKRKELGIPILISILLFIGLLVWTQFVNRHKIPLDAFLISLVPIGTYYIIEKYNSLFKIENNES